MLELKVYLGRSPSTQGSRPDLAPQRACRQPRGLLGLSASTVGHGLFPSGLCMLEGILKQQPLRKVCLKQEGLSMKEVKRAWAMAEVVISKLQRTCMGDRGCFKGTSGAGEHAGLAGVGTGVGVLDAQGWTCLGQETLPIGARSDKH